MKALLLLLALVAGIANAQPAGCVVKAKRFPQAIIYYCPGWSLVAPLSWVVARPDGVELTPHEAMVLNPDDLKRMVAMSGYSAEPNLLKAEAEKLAR